MNILTPPPSLPYGVAFCSQIRNSFLHYDSGQITCCNLSFCTAPPHTQKTRFLEPIYLEKKVSLFQYCFLPRVKGVENREQGQGSGRVIEMRQWKELDKKAELRWEKVIFGDKVIDQWEQFSACSIIVYYTSSRWEIMKCGGYLKGRVMAGAPLALIWMQIKHLWLPITKNTNSNISILHCIELKSTNHTGSSYQNSCCPAASSAFDIINHVPHLKAITLISSKRSAKGYKKLLLSIPSHIPISTLYSYHDDLVWFSIPLPANVQKGVGIWLWEIEQKIVLTQSTNIIPNINQKYQAIVRENLHPLDW